MTEIETAWHLAQINIARAIAPLDDPRMADFVAQLDAVNKIAEDTPGFIWRLKDDTGAASSYVRYSDDERIVVNMSVWTSIEALKDYVYRSGHGAVYRDRRRWFEPMTTPSLAMWWIARGEIPTLAQGRDRLARLAAHGPTAEAFTFKAMFAPPQLSPRD